MGDPALYNCKGSLKSIRKLAAGAIYDVPRRESDENLHLMRRLDEQYIRTLFYGVRQVTARLRRDGNLINEKRITWLLRLVGLEAIYQRRRLSDPARGHRIYLYLRRGIPIERPNPVSGGDH